MIQGRRFAASFSIATYGNAEAKQLATEARERQLLQAEQTSL